mgnify:CR=1 FL=1
MKRKLLSVLLTFCLAFSLLPTAALADEGDVAEVNSTGYSTLADAINAAESGATITLLADINTPETSYTIRKSLTIDLNGKTITADGYDSVFAIEGEDNHVVINATNGGKVIAVENSGSAGKYAMAVWLAGKNSTLTINGGEFSQSITSMSDPQMDMIYTSKGVITINGGTFRSATPKWTLNIKDSAYKDGSANIIVNGGKFVGYDPRNAENEGKGTSLVADGVGINKDVDGNFTAVPNMAAQIVDAAGNSVAAYATLSDAFDHVETGDTVKLLNNITLTNQVDITKALDGLTLDGNGKTITLATTTDPMQSGGSALYFGNADSRLYCTGIKIKDLTMTGTARFAIFLCGGTSTEFTNVNISGNYYIAVNLYGTHGATMTNCKISNSTTGTDEYISGIWSNVASQNPLKLVSTEVDTIAINTYTTANKLEPKIFIDKGSKAEIHTFDDGSVSGNKKLCVSTESTGSYTVKEYDETSSTWVEVPDVAVVIRNGREIGCATFTAAIAAAQDGETVKLLKDVELSSLLEIRKNLTLDLGGKKLSSNGSVLDIYSNVTIQSGTIETTFAGEGSTAAVWVNGTAKLTIESNVTMSTTANAYALAFDQSCTAAEVTFKGTVTGGNGIAVNGLIAGSTSNKLTMDGANITVSGHGIYQAGCADTAFSIENSVVSGATGIEVRAGKLTVDNSTISGSGEFKSEANSGGPTTDGAGIAIVQHTTNLPINVTISGGSISGPKAIYQATKQSQNTEESIATIRLSVTGGEFTGEISSENLKKFISGGSFSTDLKNTGYLADSVSAEVKSADGSTYSYYTSMNDALAAAKPGDTVTDLRAATEQKVTLTLKYNDGATADITYNVASGTTITLPTPAYRSGYTFNGWYDGSKFYAAGASYKVSATVTLNASWSYISSGSSSYDPTYSVSTPSKTEHGSVTVSPKNASKGDRVTVTVKPDSGYVLETLTVTDKNGNELTLKDKGNGKYTFTMPAGKVEVKATFMEDNSMLNFFYDVPNNAYFYEAVKWAVKNGITTGVGNNLFAPEQPCTRAQIVTFLWRAAGSPEPKGAASGMTDVVSGGYYEKAVAWAIENGITTGTTTSTFSPDATCTRAQAVTFLARALKAKAASAAEFSDVPTGSYFADAVAWAAANGVTEGIGGGLFGSDNDCTRGQIVTFLYRAYNK